MTENKIINAVLIEDDKPYAQELAALAREHNILITHFSNLQRATEEMEDMANLDFIILDAHCFVEEEDTSVDTGFVSEAEREIRKLEEIRGRKIPYCINTGYIKDDKMRRFRKRMEVFEKAKDHNKLFRYISELVQNENSFQIRAENENIFNIFANKLLDSKYEKDLLVLFENIEIKQTVENKALLLLIRPILEAVVVGLDKLDNNLLPRKYFTKGTPEISSILFHLAGKPTFDKARNKLEHFADQILPAHIYEPISSTYKALSKASMHHYDEAITKYFLKSCFYSLADFMNWCSVFVKENYNLK